METLIAIFAALTAAVALNISVFLQKKAVGSLPAVKFQVSWTVFKAFVTNRPWLFSISISAVGGAFLAVAITLAPISVVQPIVASGVALLAYLAIRNLGEKPRRIDLYAIGLTIVGVALIGVSMAEGIPENLKHDPVELWAFAGGAVFLATVFPLVMRRGGGNKEAAGLGIAVGILFGTGAMFARLLLLDWANQWAAQGVMVIFSSVFVLAWGCVMLPGFITLQAALQRGMAVVVVPLVAGLAQVVPITGGMVALNEPLPNNKVLAGLRILAFGLILFSTVILSRRAEETAPAGEGLGEPGVSLPEEGC